MYLGNGVFGDPDLSRMAPGGRVPSRGYRRLKGMSCGQTDYVFFTDAETRVPHESLPLLETEEQLRRALQRPAGAPRCAIDGYGNMGICFAV